MNTGVLIFWLFTSACLGAVVGGLIERRLNRHSSPGLPPIPSDNKLAREGDLEILRAWRTQAGKIWLDMDGTHLEDKAALQTDQRRRLLNVVLDLRPWLETAPGVEIGLEVQAPPVVPAVQPEKKKGKPTDEANKPAPVLKTIIQQIDDVLQIKLETSMFKDRGIQLVEGPGGIVLVKDGVKKYEGVDSVPDPEIKALIRQAVTDWEKGAK
jgi:hypothetical protein